MEEVGESRTGGGEVERMEGLKVGENERVKAA